MADAAPIGVNDGGVRTWRWRRVGEPPKRLFLAAVAVAAFASLWNQSYPHGNGWYSAGSLGLWLVLGAVWTAMLANAVLRRAGRARLRARRIWPAWLVVPALVVLMGLATAGDVTLKARFAASRSALQDVAASTRDADPAGGFTPRRAGLYTVTDAFRVDDGVVLEIAASEGPLPGRGGFAYFPGPHGAVVWASGVTYTHLSGAWYSWSGV